MSDIYHAPDRYSEWLRLFLDNIQEITIARHVSQHEGYKFKSVNTFQTHFDIEATDLAGNLDQAIYTNNLVVGAMYFPKKMLLIYAEQFPEETRQLLRHLFDASVDAEERINDTKRGFEELEKLRAQRKGRSPYNTFIGLRFISLLLGFYDPNRYNALKPSEWKVFARFVNPDFVMPHKTSAGQQYAIYSQYIEGLRAFIKNRPEIAEIKNALTDGLEFKDDEFRWMTQDVIFVTARVYADMRSSELSAEQPADEAIETRAVPTGYEDAEDTGFMALEAHLEEYVVRNWNNIDFGEKLTIHVDDDGTTGQQFVTDVGIIDILARDEKGDYVVIELKRADSGFKVVGQILNYIGWVQDHLANGSQKARGLIVVGKADKTLMSALKPVGHLVKLKEYRVTMQLKDKDISNST